MSVALEGSVLTPDGWRAGRLRCDAGVIAVEGAPTETPAAPFVLPGFVDLHVHGGGGADMMAGGDAIRRAARLHARHGTTALLATSVTAPPEATAAFLDAVRDAMREGAPEGAQEGARVLGAHLEGPFLNPAKLGAQPPFAAAPDLALLADWLKRAPVLAMTFAPECDPGGALLAALKAAGVRPQIGHTLCSYAEGTAALLAGCGATHLFNAMSGLAHRDNGAAGAALAHAEFAEIIPDLIHVEAGAILAARRAIPGLYGVTDATAGAGMPDGVYALGGQRVIKRGGAMRLESGALAGSALTMDAALRNLVAIGLPLAEASRRLSATPAAWLGRADIGRLAPGARADVVTLNGALEVERVLIGGRPVDLMRA
ncbi:N-acetylglucosamine-6-phosphate deacetylase [Rubrimonas cliftonensis]|uniref:N-acetylglucosamine 6-phosphate deacetylase n=1 Tax=Rubrimonas cliftonensis TaxID=89524 RepID=A0A1H4B981_9RHOB|nr:amidohydrolase family protein [Rubrimonas cliftonensis]SEA44518.1 N-acetylglucosamine 6-phosphate deacetylase [Rubrimonas cliftonensis]